MDNRGDQRPPRAARPAAPRPTAAPASTIPDHHRSSLVPDSKVGVSFSNVEQGDRNASLDGQRHRSMPSAYQPHFNNGDPELTDHLDPTKVGRKKSLVRPDREKIDPGHRQWHYRSHVAQLEEEGLGRVGVMPSCEFLTVRSSTCLTSFFF
jgi:chitin synthase